MTSMSHQNHHQHQAMTSWHPAAAATKTVPSAPVGYLHHQLHHTNINNNNSNQHHHTHQHYNQNHLETLDTSYQLGALDMNTTDSTQSSQSTGSAAANQQQHYNHLTTSGTRPSAPETSQHHPPARQQFQHSASTPGGGSSAVAASAPSEISDEVQSNFRKSGSPLSSLKSSGLLSPQAHHQHHQHHQVHMQDPTSYSSQTTTDTMMPNADTHSRQLAYQQQQQPHQQQHHHHLHHQATTRASSGTTNNNVTNYYHEPNYQDQSHQDYYAHMIHHQHRPANIADSSYHQRASPAAAVAAAAAATWPNLAQSTSPQIASSPAIISHHQFQLGPSAHPSTHPSNQLPAPPTVSPYSNSVGYTNGYPQTHMQVAAAVAAAAQQPAPQQQPQHPHYPIAHHQHHHPSVVQHHQHHQAVIMQSSAQSPDDIYSQHHHHSHPHPHHHHPHHNQNLQNQNQHQHQHHNQQQQPPQHVATYNQFPAHRATAIQSPISKLTSPNMHNNSSAAQNPQVIAHHPARQYLPATGTTSGNNNNNNNSSKVPTTSSENLVLNSRANSTGIICSNLSPKPQLHQANILASPNSGNTTTIGLQLCRRQSSSVVSTSSAGSNMSDHLSLTESPSNIHPAAMPTSDAKTLVNDKVIARADCTDRLSEQGKPSQLSQLHQQCAVILDEQQHGVAAINPPNTTNNNGNDASNSSNNNNGSNTNNANNNGSNTSGRSKRLRTSFKHNQLKEMKRWFSKNQNPDAKDLKTLAQHTGLSKRVLQVWFQNARAKFRRNNARAANQQLYDANPHNSCLLEFQQHQQQNYHHHQQQHHQHHHTTRSLHTADNLPINSQLQQQVSQQQQQQQHHHLPSQDSTNTALGRTFAPLGGVHQTTAASALVVSGSATTAPIVATNNLLDHQTSPSTQLHHNMKQEPCE